MADLGILLACPHYPAVTADPRRLSRALRALIEPETGPIGRVSVYPVFDGVFPAFVEHSDAWLVSGPVLDWGEDPAAHGRRLTELIRTIAARRPVYGVWFGEDALRAAFPAPGGDGPSTRRFPTSIRNPIRHFGARDRLFRWDAGSGRVVALGHEAAAQAPSALGTRSAGPRHQSSPAAFRPSI